MKKPFNINYRQKIESGEYKVVTRDGRAVRIVCWDMKAPVSLIGCVERKEEGDEELLLWYKDGANKRDANYRAVETKNDLFVITDEPELTKVEEEIVMAIVDYTANKEGCFTEIDCARKHCTRIMDAARAEIAKDYPRWRRLPLSGVSYSPDTWMLMDVITSEVNGNSAAVSALVKGNHYVPLFELEKLIRKQYDEKADDCTAGRLDAGMR